MEKDPQSLIPYQLTFEYLPEYLYAFVTAEEDSLELSLAYWREVAEAVEKKDYKKLLVEEDIEKIIESVFEMYQFINELMELFKDVRVAFVDRHLPKHEINRFGELVATNRGMVCKVFDEREKAEKWLLKL